MSGELPDSSSLDQPSAAPPRGLPPGSKSILSFWEPQSVTSSVSFPPTTALSAKRPRKKAQDDASQGRLSLGAGNGTWTIGRSDADSSGSAAVEAAPIAGPSRLQKGKGAGLSEAQEMREMARRAKLAEKEAKEREKQAVREAKAAEKEAKERDKLERAEAKGQARAEKAEKKKRKSLEGDTDPSVEPDLDGALGGARTTRSTATPSPAKKKVRPRASQAAAGVASSSPTDILITGQTLRNPHPFFNRSTSAISSGASHDPISLDESPPSRNAGPKRVFFAADRQPVHAFFTHPPSAASCSLPMSRTASAASQAPSDTLGMEKGKKKVMHGFFSGKSDSTLGAGQVKAGWGGGIKEGDEAVASLPRGLWPSHCGYIGCTSGPTSTSSQRKRLEASTAESEVPGSSWASLIEIEPSPNGNQHAAQHGRYHQPIPMLRHHAAFAFKTARQIGGQTMWAEMYRPSSASGILGNECEAVYLREWLRALEVGNTATVGRKVHRKVRRLKRQLFDGWIVDDAGLFGDIAEDADDDDPYEEYEEPEFALGERPNSYPNIDGRLTNCILLSGPHGTGKTASVYTAAEELGWEVFEVYPGMGRRTAANLMSWVGDVGRNHMVVKGKKDKNDAVEVEKVTGIQSFFGNGHDAADSSRDSDPRSTPPPRKKAKKNVVMSSSQGSEHDPIDVIGEDEDGLDQDETTPNGNMRHKAQQSLILIDEADILFAEENTFWPAIIALIADSRRPVILTCNDPDRIPLAQLPLQAILHFQPAFSWLAIPYLDAVASNAGIATSSYGAELYERASQVPPEHLDGPFAPNGHEWLPFFDLRRALAQLQLDRGRLSLRPDIFEVDHTDLHSVYRSLEAVSYADAHIGPFMPDLIELDEVDRHSPTPDDELGPHLLRKGRASDCRPILTGYDQSEAISDTLVELAGGRLEPCGDLSVDQINHVRSLLPSLDPLIPLNSYLLPHSSLFLDYIPAIQILVEADDIDEEEEEAMVSQGGARLNRKTGRPKRAAGLGGSLAGFERYLDLEPEALQSVRASKLVYE